MADIDEALERLGNDPEFKDQLARDPGAALAGYDLTADDLALLAQKVIGDEDDLAPVEQRVRRAGFFGLYAQRVSGSEDAEADAAVDDPDRAQLGGPDT